MATPPPVTGFTVTSHNYRQIFLTWDLYDPVTQISNFRIYVGLDAADRTNMTQENRNTNTLTVSRYPFGAANSFLVPGTLYYITIIGFLNPNLPSLETQITQSTDVLAAPTGFTSPAQTDTSITTTWDAYPNATALSHFNFLYDTTDPPAISYQINRSHTTRTIHGLIPNTLYYINLEAEITQTDPLPTFISPPATLEVVTNASPPTNLQILMTTPTRITIGWTNPLYPPTNILLAISTTGTFTDTVTLDPGFITYEWDSLVPGTLYYFRVRNVSQSGVVTDAITTNTTTSPTPPVESILFSGITSTAFDAGLAFNTFTPEEIGFRIGTTNPPDGAYTYIPAETLLGFSGRDEDTNYFLEVVARISGVDSTPLVAGVYTSNATPSNFTPVDAPTFNSVLMGWDPSPSPTTGYDIWISTVDGVFPGAGTPLGIINEYEFTGLTADTTYYFKLVDLGTGGPSEPTYSVALTASAPANTSNFILYIYKATNGFKHSAHSLQRSNRGLVVRQVRGGW